MMKNIFFVFILFFLLLAPVFHSNAQSTSPSNVFDTTGFPQWAKDLRRWDIIAFGSFPFSIFAITFFTDLYRWSEAYNGNIFSEAAMSEEGRRYAPWPLKSAGAVEMTKDEYVRTIYLAAGLSAAVAITDLIILKTKQSRERRRIQSKPAGTVIVDIVPYGISDKEDEENPDVTDILDNDSGSDINVE
jgi:hypothetical protein